MTDRPAPTAEGRFEKTPFAHVLVYARERALTGTLVVQVEGEPPELVGESLYALQSGALAHARLPKVIDPLGFVLREMNAITDEQLHASLQRLAAGEGLQGEILLAMGACAPEAIEQAMRVQLRRKAIRMFGVRRASYQYFDGLDLLAGFGRERVTVDVFAVLWRGVRAHPSQSMIDPVLDRVGSLQLRLRAGADLRAFGFDRNEQGPLDVLRAGPVSLDALVRAAPDARIGRAIAYVLLIAKQLETTSATAPARASTPPIAAPARPFGETSVRVPAAPPTTKPAAPPPEATADDVPPEFRARFEEARQRLESMEDENYFQMLGVATSVGADEVRQAFLSLAARWHPDRAPPNITALRDLHERIFAYLSEAQDTLSRDEVRGRYFAAVQEGGGTPNSQRRIGALIEAATDAQKAEVCMKRREYAEAERLSRRALKVAPDDPNALTVLASALAEIRADGPHDEAIKLLQHAVEISPKHDRAHVLLAMLYRRIGNSVRALDHFRLAAAANPRNVDATREVRLAEMRGRTSGAPQPDPGAGAKPRESLFSKLLKR